LHTHRVHRGMSCKSVRRAADTGIYGPEP
jgi:hypothetical protein